MDQGADLPERRDLMLALGVGFMQAPVAFAVLVGLRDATSRRDRPMSGSEAVATLRTLAGDRAA